jgi:hypothetical protein
LKLRRNQKVLGIDLRAVTGEVEQRDVVGAQTVAECGDSGGQRPSSRILEQRDSEANLLQLLRDRPRVVARVREPGATIAVVADDQRQATLGGGRWAQQRPIAALPAKNDSSGQRNCGRDHKETEATAHMSMTSVSSADRPTNDSRSTSR